MNETMRDAIRDALKEGKSSFIIYPFGKQGKIFKNILNRDFGINELAVMDNYCLSDECNVIKTEDVQKYLDENCIIFLVSDNYSIYFELRREILKYVSAERIVDVLSPKHFFQNWSYINVLDSLERKEKVKVVFNPVMQTVMHYGIDEWKTNDEKMSAVGKNTGNLVYSETIKEHLNYDLETVLTSDWTKERLGQRNVFSIMPASNFLAPYATWIEYLIPILECTDMHFTLVGLGAQAALDETPKDVVSKLSEKQKYFFKLVSERAVTIGVRGEFTAECLGVLGIHNVEVIGCPSYYQYEGNYPILPNPKLDKVLYTAQNGKDKIYKIAEKANAQLICQDFLDTQCNQVIFFDYEKWNQYIRQGEYSFAFGSRFHGNMMALRNGVPTLWIVHDWRTLELVQYLGLPYINYYDPKFQKIKYVEELLEYCDYSKVYAKYPQLLEKYNKFMKCNL